MVVERITEYLDYKGISVSAFEKSTGMSNASFSKSLKSGGSIGSDKLETILSHYPDLSAEWLVRGEGDMLRPKADRNSHSLEDVSRELAQVLRKMVDSNNQRA